MINELHTNWPNKLAKEPVKGKHVRKDRECTKSFPEKGLQVKKFP